MGRRPKEEEEEERPEPPGARRAAMLAEAQTPPRPAAAGKAGLELPDGTPAGGPGPAAEVGKSVAAEALERGRALRRGGREVYPLVFGGDSPFPCVPGLEAALERHGADRDRAPVEGLRELRKAVCQRYSDDTGHRCGRQQVVVGPGSTELLWLVLMALECHVLLPAPFWEKFAAQAKLLGRPIVWMDTMDNPEKVVTPQALRQYCVGIEGAKVLVLAQPGNPLGQQYTIPQLQALAAEAREQGVVVLADETLAGTAFEAEFESMARFYPEVSPCGAGRGGRGD